MGQRYTFRELTTEPNRTRTRPTILGYNLRAMSDHISALPERSELIFISKGFLGEPSFPMLATFFKILFYLLFYSAGFY